MATFHLPSKEHTNIRARRNFPPAAAGGAAGGTGVSAKFVRMDVDSLDADEPAIKKHAMTCWTCGKESLSPSVTLTAAPMTTTVTSPLSGNLQVVGRRCPPRRATLAAASRDSQTSRGVVVVGGVGGGLFSSERARTKRVRLPRGFASSTLPSSSRGPHPVAALPPTVDEIPALFQSVLVRRLRARGARGCRVTSQIQTTRPSVRTPNRRYH